MIQHDPVCFDCEEPVRSLTDAVFAPPWQDDRNFPSAVFHGICLMRWRERRDTIKRALLDHMRGECSCYRPDPEDTP